MSIRDNKYPVHDHIFIQRVLISVFDKRGLAELIPTLLAHNPNVMIYSTGGTGAEIAKILGERAKKNYTPVEEFTGAPEMEGGVVKTLHPKIHAGLLAERDNPNHKRFLEWVLAEFGQGPGVFFDLVVCNLYPFAQVVADPDCTPEKARGNIDIGGPTMVRAAAKNWPSVLVLTDPSQYDRVQAGNFNTLKLRFELAGVAFQMVVEYDSAISDFLSGKDFARDIRPTLNVKEGT